MRTAARPRVPAPTRSTRDAGERGVARLRDRPRKAAARWSRGLRVGAKRRARDARPAGASRSTRCSPILIPRPSRALMSAGAADNRNVRRTPLHASSTCVDHVAASSSTQRAQTSSTQPLESPPPIEHASARLKDRRVTREHPGVIHRHRGRSIFRGPHRGQRSRDLTSPLTITERVVLVDTARQKHFVENRNRACYRLDMAQDVESLGEWIAEQAAHLDAATHRLLTAVREFDAADGWYKQGARSCAEWLSWRVGWSRQTARDRVRVAQRLGDLPLIDDELRRGALSYCKVRAMTRVATSATEAALIELARSSTGAQLERICRKYAAVQRQGTEPDARYDAEHGTSRVASSTAASSRSARDCIPRRPQRCGPRSIGS